MVAPSGQAFYCEEGVWSLDQMDWKGFNPDYTYSWVCGDITWECNYTYDMDYNCHFGGTSAATPIVAGTAALLLSLDSTLTVREVYDILRNSAVKDLDWGTITDSLRLEYGHGRVDAFRAVLSMARGDVNSDGRINLADISMLIDYVYMNGPEPFPSRLLGDCNCNGKINLADIGKLISYVYQDGELVVPCYLFE